MAEKEFILKLKEYLFSTYPEDNNIKQWFQKYSEEFGHKKPVLKRTRSVVKRDVKDKLLESYSEERTISGEIKIETETEESCVNSIKLLELSIKSNKRDIIYKSALQGQVIDNLKKLRKGNTGVFLAQHGIKFSVSYCNSLVRLYKLVEAHSNLIKCSVDLRLIIQNMKVVKEICEELHW